MNPTDDLKDKVVVNQLVREPANPFTKESANAYRRKAVEALLGLNPKTWQDLETKGVIPLEGTYAECIQAIFKHYQKSNEVKLLRAEARGESGFGSKPSFDTKSGLSPLQEAEIIKKIKLNMAREEQLHLSNSKDRGLLLDKQELLELLSPIIGNIASVLRNAADMEPAVQPVIDKCFENLFNAGKILAQHCEVDSERYVRERMKEEVDLEEILASAELEVY
jgi:hypothetical protein